MQDSDNELPKLSHGPFTLDRNSEQLGQLADKHRQRDTVHVAVTDRLGEQFGDEAESRQAGNNADDSRDDRHHARKRDGAHRIAAGQREDDAEDDGRQRRVRSKNENAAGSEQRVCQQRHDGGIEAIDTGNTRRYRVGDANRHQHRCQNHPGDNILRKPSRFILAKSNEPWQPPYPVNRLLRFHLRFRQVGLGKRMNSRYILWMLWQAGAVIELARHAALRCRAMAQSFARRKAI